MIDKEMVERLATVANDGSFTSDAAKQYMVKKVVLVLFNLTKDDVKKICNELKITLD